MKTSLIIIILLVFNQLLGFITSFYYHENQILQHYKLEQDQAYVEILNSLEEYKNEIENYTTNNIANSRRK